MSPSNNDPSTGETNERASQGFGEGSQTFGGGSQTYGEGSQTYGQAGQGFNEGSQGFGASENGSKVVESVKTKGKEAVEGARSAAERGKDKLADEAQGVARALHQASEGMRSDDHEELARYTQVVADKIEQLSSSLKDKDLASMARDVTRFAQRQPALFLGGAFTVGLIAARFLKSSSTDTGIQSGAE